MTIPGKIIAFPPIAVPRPSTGDRRSFEGYPRFAREYESPPPLPPRATVPPTIVTRDE